MLVWHAAHDLDRAVFNIAAGGNGAIGSNPISEELRRADGTAGAISAKLNRVYALQDLVRALKPLIPMLW